MCKLCTFKFALTGIQDPCETSNCLNNATCRAFNDTAHECICLPGYLGDNCEIGKKMLCQFHVYICWKKMKHVGLHLDVLHK